MRPAKYRPKKDQSNRAERAKALARLENLWKLDNEDGEWEPETEPIVTPMLKVVPGGIEFCIQALRAHDEDDARQFLETYDKLKKGERARVRIEDIAHASGVGSLRLAEIIQTALYLYGDRQAQMILSASMPKVIKSTVKAATDEVPIVVDTLDGRIVVGHTNGDVKAMEMLLKSRGILPIPKGSQIAIQVNSGEKSEREPEGGHEWKYPEDRLKEIVSVINPKQLEAGKQSTGELIHFDQNKPMVFER
jgi:hypothetical protein